MWIKSTSETKTGNEDIIVIEKSLKMENIYAQRGARTHDPEIKSLMLYRLS